MDNRPEGVGGCSVFVLLKSKYIYIFFIDLAPDMPSRRGVVLSTYSKCFKGYSKYIQKIHKKKGPLLALVVMVVLIL